MGEAKRRKANDPAYGRAKRGLIITCPIEPLPNGFSIKSAEIDPYELRHALLFWDSLVFPTNNLIHIGSTPDIQFLESVGILERPRYSFASATNAEPLIKSQLLAFRERDGQSNGVWDICQNSAVLMQGAAEVARGAGFQLELLNVIPIPEKDVPLNEILEFKRKRNDEFLALRSQIDEFVQAINSSGDPHGELKRRIDLVDKACADALKVSSEWQFPVRLSNQKATFDLKPFEAVAAGASAYFGAVALGFSQAALAALGAAAVTAKSSLKISGDIGWRGLKRRPSPFAYVARIGSELI